MDSYGAAINDHNHVVGKARDVTEDFQGFLWSRWGGMIAIGNLGGDYTQANDINNFDVIVGRSRDASGNFQPFIWQAGTMTPLPTLGGLYGEAKSLNDFDDVVGYSTDTSSQQYACLWQNGGAINLDTSIAPGSGWLLTGANDINELGEICGTGYLNGVQRAYKLTPITNTSRLSGFQPGFSGQTNRLFGMGYSPGAIVELYAGLNAGNTTTTCGAVVGIASARLVTTTTAGPDGRIEIDLMLPQQVAGASVLLQAVEPTSCSVGDLRHQLLQ